MSEDVPDSDFDVRQTRIVFDLPCKCFSCVIMICHSSVLTLPCDHEFVIFHASMPTAHASIERCSTHACMHAGGRGR